MRNGCFSIERLQSEDAMVILSRLERRGALREVLLRSRVSHDVQVVTVRWELYTAEYAEPLQVYESTISGGSMNGRSVAYEEISAAEQGHFYLTASLLKEDGRLIDINPTYVRACKQSW